MNPIQSFLDGLFAQLEAAIQASSLGFLKKSLALMVLKQFQQALDALFSGKPQFQGVGAAALSPAQIKELIDEGLAMLSTIFGSDEKLAAIIAAIKLAVDSFLSAQAAPLLAWQCEPCGPCVV